MKNAQSKLFRLMVGGLVLFVTLIPIVPDVAYSATSETTRLRRGVDYAYWQFPSPANDFWNIDQSLQIDIKGEHTFWSMQFPFTGSTDNGYIGLQDEGVLFGGGTGDLALFSLWNANQARGASCHTFSGEGVGYSCQIPFEVKTGVSYRLRVWRLEAEDDNQWWGGWVYDSSSGIDYHIGDIREPANAHQLLGQPLNFREYFGPSLPCNQQPDSLSVFSAPSANYHGSDSGVYDYYSTRAGVGKGGCYNDLEVTKSLDDGSEGTFSYVLTNATSGQTITFDNSVTNVTFTTNHSPLPPLKPGVNLEGSCGAASPQIVIDGTGLSGDGLTLQGNNQVAGISLRRFGNRQIVISSKGNSFMQSCVKISKY